MEAHVFGVITPSEVTSAIQRLCQKLVQDPKPVFLDVTPELGAKVVMCFVNVEAQIAKAGGTIQIGWRIAEWPKVFFEAEFHAVWRDPEGNLRDITPRPDGTNRILFLPDNVRTYQGHQLNNVREPLAPHCEIKKYIAALDALFEFENRGGRASQHGEWLLYGDEADEYTRLKDERKEVERRMCLKVFGPPRTTPSVAKRPGRNDPCSCGSGKKYKRCHGR